MIVVVASAGAGQSPITAEHRKWLEEEVPYIITDRERELFLALETAEERERLIEAFWRRRDPNPLTAENEFRTEHYRRLEFANRALGRESVRPGWRTDRGKMYIILGEPRERQRFDGLNEIVSTELWFYESDTARGLPPFFYLIFFRPREVSEYRLYHPVLDGPLALFRVRQEWQSHADVMNALNDISPELARATLSLDPSDPGDYFSGRASPGTNSLFARIEEFPKRSVRADYADAALRHRDAVSIEYSFNFVPCRSVFAVIPGPGESSFVHYSIEIDPQDFALETDDAQSKYYSALEVRLEVKDEASNIVIARDDSIYVELSPSQFELVRALPFAFEDNFPLVAGDYDVTVILKNSVLKRYTIAEREIQVEPPSRDTPTLSEILLGFDIEEAAEDRPVLETFRIGSSRVYPAADHIFSLGETVHAFSLVRSAEADNKLRFTLLLDDELLQERFGRVGDYPDGLIREQFSLMGMAGGELTLRFELLDRSGAFVSKKSVRIVASPRTSIPRAGYIHRRGFDAAVPGLVSLARGEQFWAMKRYDLAEAELEKAVAASNPQLPMAAWKLAGVYIRTGRPDEALRLLEALEESHPNEYEVLAGLGLAYYLKQEPAKAVPYLDRAVRMQPTRIALLNALGESYQRLGNLDKALEIFERSLTLNPAQDEIKRRLTSLSPANQR